MWLQAHSSALTPPPTHGSTKPAQQHCGSRTYEAAITSVRWALTCVSLDQPGANMGLRGRSMRRDVRTSPSFGLPSLFSQLPLQQHGLVSAWRCTSTLTSPCITFTCGDRQSQSIQPLLTGVWKCGTRGPASSAEALRVVDCQGQEGAVCCGFPAAARRGIHHLHAHP